MWIMVIISIISSFLHMESQNIILPPSLRSEDVNEIKNTFIVFAGSEDGILNESIVKS